jgi:uncharacterized protein YdcH (DUF465 family)
MEKKIEEVIGSLLEQDPELKRYYEEHLELEKKLLNFQNKSYLTPVEETEKKKLKKLKLLGKDRIMAILGKYRQAEMSGRTE